MAGGERALNDVPDAASITTAARLFGKVGGLLKAISPLQVVSLFAGQASGLATLDAGTKVPLAQLDMTGIGGAIGALPVGALSWWPTDTPPTGWLARDGALVSRTTYAALFAALVTTPGFTGQTFTVTIASPGVVTKTSHGFNGGELLRLSTTGALPTGLNTTSDYFVIYVDANTFRLATSEANYAAGTAINTSGSQSGTHTYTRSLYGLGDGSTTFKLPDDRDLFERGKPASGRSIGTYQADDNKAHTHLVSGPSGGADTLGTTNNVANASVASFSSGGAEARPKNRAYLPIIKFQ